jgi:dihydroorotase
MFRSGLRPHLFCLPVLKRKRHKMSLLKLATSDLPFVYAGTDSAPHDRRKKECDCCSGGVASAHAAIEMYVEALVGAGVHSDAQIDRFLSGNGLAFYGLHHETRGIEIRRTSWTVDSMFKYSEDPQDIIRPFGFEEDEKARRAFQWKLAA